VPQHPSVFARLRRNLGCSELFPADINIAESRGSNPSRNSKRSTSQFKITAVRWRGTRHEMGSTTFSTISRKQAFSTFPSAPHGREIVPFETCWHCSRNHNGIGFAVESHGCAWPSGTHCEDLLVRWLENFSEAAFLHSMRVTNIFTCGFSVPENPARSD
jgi:hypothetical protein